MRNFYLCLAVAAVMLGAANRVNADAADDRNAAQQIAENLRLSGELKDYRVGVKYENGVAWLMGTVTSNKQKAIAERLARRSAGVDKVISKLEVPGGQTQQGNADAEFAAQRTQQRGQAIQPASANELQTVMPRRAAAGRMPVGQPSGHMPRPFARAGQPGGVQPGGVHPAGYGEYYGPGQGVGGPQPLSHVPPSVGRAVSYDNPQLPGYAWPSYAANPNYAALTYPKQYSASAWPYIGPFYPYPQVPLGWRKVTLEWDDGWWFLDFKDNCCN